MSIEKENKNEEVIMNLRKKNLLINNNEISNKEIILKSKPSFLHIVLTTRCNLKCIMCTQKQFDYTMPDNVYDYVFELIKYAENITWQGGEVFLYKNFKKLFYEANKYKIRQSIITNGLLINEEFIKTIAQNNIFLTISIDSVKKEIYEQIRVGGKFETLLNVLDKIKNYRDSFRNPSFVLQMAVVVMKINHKEIKNMVDFAIGYGFNEIIFHKYSSCGKETDEILKLNEEENDSVLDEINVLREDIKLNKKIKIITSLGYLKKNRIEIKKNLELSEKKEEKNINLSCLAPWKSLYIGEDMNVMPACHCRTFADKNLFDDGKFWNGTIMQKFRKSVMDNNLLEHCIKVCFNSGDVGKFLRGL